MSVEIVSPTAPVTVVECEEVVQTFSVRQRGRRGKVQLSAVAGISFSVCEGETFAIVGETGSGKSTLARTLVGAPAAASGSVRVRGTEIADISARASDRLAQRAAQMVFQNPMAALDPTWTVERTLNEPLLAIDKYRHDRQARRARVAEILKLIGLPASRFAGRRPAELSGGQAQRVAIARALICDPDLVILDEPVTALDVSVQAQIVELLIRLQHELDLTYVLIAHDLAVVRRLANRVATMYLGIFCEVGDANVIFDKPAHPYTTALLSAVPEGLDEQGGARVRIRLQGDPPSPLDPPSGCRFRTRCPYAQERCTAEVPALQSLGDGREVACHFPFVAVGGAAATTTQGQTD